MVIVTIYILHYCTQFRLTDNTNRWIPDVC